MDSFRSQPINVFWQIPVSVAQVFVTSDAEFAVTKPYPLEKIPPDLTRLRVRKALHRKAHNCRLAG